VATVAMETDLELMLRVTRGDEGSFEELLRRHGAPLTNYLRRMLRESALAEDLAQEVFLRVYQARERYRPDARFTTWLYRIATNLALNAIRDRKGEVPQAEGESAEDGSGAARLVDSRPNVEQQLMQSDRERLIRQAIEELPERQRAAVILHKYQDVDYQQIAKVLGVSESAVKSLLFRAYESLRTRLEPLLVGGQL
jgi:RNA polymerase sigma-70 factor (ECF subfamily)